MAHKTSKFITYMLRGLPTGIFGEAYVIVTGSEISKGEFCAEYFIFTQRPSESVKSGQIKFSNRDFPSELGKIDIKFIISEVLRQAEIEIQQLLESRATEIKRVDLAYLPFELKEHLYNFTGCKMRGRFINQLIDVQNFTQCPSLFSYLNLLQQVKTVCAE